MNNDTIMKNFQAALNHSISRIGYGAQRIIAKKSGVSQQYISGIVSGKRFGKEDVRRSIAKACGYEYEQFLKFGESLILCETGPYRKFEVEEEFFWALREICLDPVRFNKLIQDTGIEELRFKRIFNHFK
jgi:transcriptional regulator with XRE-family HTH domain